MPKLLILNNSDKDQTLDALKAAAQHAGPKTRATLAGLHDALAKSNPTAGRARRKEEVSPMAKRTTKRASARKTTKAPKAKTRTVTKLVHVKSNPEPAAPRRRRSISNRLKGINVMEVAKRGAVVAGGMLAQSFVARQSERLLPNMPRVVHQLVGSGVVTAASLMLLKGQVGEDLAVSAVAAGLQGLAHEFMPGVFAGVEDQEAAYVQGYEDAQQVQGLAAYDDGFQNMEGLSFTGDIPSSIPGRPAGL